MTVDFSGSAIERLQQIAETSDESLRADMVNSMVSMLWPDVLRLTASLANHYRLDRNRWGDDVQSLVTEQIVIIVRDVCEGRESVESINSFAGLLSYRANSAVRVWMDSSAGLNSASRQVSLKRRIKEMRQTRDELWQELGDEPTPEQVIERTNERMLRRRADARRQGMICDREDYDRMFSGGNVSIDDEAAHVVPVATTVEDDSDLHSSERHGLINKTVRRSREVSEVHGQIAAMWLTPMLGSGELEMPTAKDIADALGLTAPTVRRKLAEVRVVAQEILAEMGIAPPSAAPEEEPMLHPSHDSYAPDGEHRMWVRPSSVSSA